jgi:hypothetical protein
MRLWKPVEGHQPISIHLQALRHVGVALLLTPVRNPVTPLFGFATRGAYGTGTVAFWRRAAAGWGTYR